MSAEILNPALFQLGFGGFAGFVVGYAFKKMVKMLLVLVGLFFVALQYLAYTGFIEINYDKIMQSLQGLTKLFEGGFSLPAFLTANIPFTASFTAGFGIGLKMG